MDYRSRSFKELIDKDSKTTPKVSFFGAIRPDLLPLLGAGMTLPSIYMLEDKNGDWHATGCYANDLLTTVAAYLRAGEDTFHTLRKVGEGEITLNIIRASNSNHQINNFLEILKLNNVSR